ncbi:MAG: hypothetical protein GXN94_00610 [Aquificae bacterium]|nr:hypothetical protein [Aquificota bacterium]
MSIFQFLVRVFIALAVASSLFMGKIEYSTALALLSGIYILAFLLIPKNATSRYIILLMDVVFLSLSIYLTGYTYLAFLVVPLFAEFVRDWKDTIYFLLLSAFPVAVALFVSGFNDYTVVPITVAGLLGTAGLYKTFADRERYFRHLKNEMENLYIKNISFQEMVDRLGKLKEVYSSLKKLRKEKLPLKLWIYDINEKLGTDGIVYFDFINHKCYSTGEAVCKKELLQHIDSPFLVFRNHQVNDLMEAPFVYALTVEDRDRVYGILIFVSKLKEVDQQLLEVVGEQLFLYFIENSDQKPSDKDSGIAAGGEGEGKGD